MIEKYISFISNQKRYSVNTSIAYNNDLLEFESFLISNHDSLDFVFVNHQIIRDYLSFMSEKKLTNRTINRKISALKGFYKFLTDKFNLDQNPTNQISVLKTRKQVQIPFTIQEMALLFDELSNGNDFEGKRDKILILLLYTTGVRRSEAVNIKWTDINMAQRTIKVLGKRNKERIIPIIEEFIEAFKTYKISFLEKFNKEGIYLFVDEKGKQLKEFVVYNVVKFYLSKVTTKYKKSPHILRHTFATHLLNSGAEINAIKDLLGHSSLAATQVYAHADINQLKKVFNNTHPRSSKFNKTK